jgi:hypothetical protein
MGNLSLYNVNALWDGSGVLPGLGGNLGLRFALLPRTGPEAQLNVAVGAFVGFESVNWAAALSPGVRLEVMGVRTNSLLIPYLSLSLFGQVVVPMEGVSGPFGRAGLAVSWNIASALNHSGAGLGSIGGNWGSGGGWVIIPVLIAAAIISFGDLRVYFQTDPRTGQLVGGLSIGFGF